MGGFAGRYMIGLVGMWVWMDRPVPTQMSLHTPEQPEWLATWPTIRRAAGEMNGWVTRRMKGAGLIAFMYKK